MEICPQCFSQNGGNSSTIEVHVFSPFKDNSHIHLQYGPNILNIDYRSYRNSDCAALTAPEEQAPRVGSPWLKSNQTQRRLKALPLTPKTMIVVASCHVAVCTTCRESSKNILVVEGVPFNDVRCSDLAVGRQAEWQSQIRLLSCFLLTAFVVGPVS